VLSPDDALAHRINGLFERYGEDLPIEETAIHVTRIINDNQSTNIPTRQFLSLYDSGVDNLVK